MTTTTDWALPPPIDNHGAELSNAIDAMLLKERVQVLRSNVKTLLVCANQRVDDEFRIQVLDALGGKNIVDLDQPGTCAEISTLAFSKENTAHVRKILAVFEPSLFVWLVDIGRDDMKRGLKKALSNYLLATRGFAIEMGSAIIVVFHDGQFVAEEISRNLALYRNNILPTLPSNDDKCTVSNILRSIEAEFAAATRASGSRPLSFSFVSVDRVPAIELRKVIVAEMSRVRQLLEDSVVVGYSSPSPPPPPTVPPQSSAPSPITMLVAITAIIIGTYYMFFR